MKTARQTQILEIISSHDVETQEQLLDEPRARGIQTTQATISRDIRELRVVKVMGPEGRYRYEAASRESAGGDRLQNIFRECVVSIDSAQNLAVVRTMPGLAGAAGSAIDSMAPAGLLGTLAGDDTVLAVMRDTAAAVSLCGEIRAMLR